MANNEGKVCDVVVRFLERRERQPRTGVLRPETSGRDSQVDLQLMLGSQVYAIEHTQIEAFEHQVRSGRHFGELIGPVKTALSDPLPGDAVYDLHFPIETGLGKKSSDLIRAQRALVHWVRENAALLHAWDGEICAEETYSGLHHLTVSGRPSGFPYEVTLHRRTRSRLTRDEPGFLDVLRVLPGDFESWRVARLRRAIQAKCPKLRQCKEDGARTVLVLESNDLRLSNSVLIREALVPALDERQDAPDEVYLVETTSRAWAVYPLVAGGELLPIAPVDFMEFSEGDLVDLCDVSPVASEPLHGS